jgi:hypothetical protein
MFANFFSTRPKHKHTRLPQRDSGRLDNETPLAPAQAEPEPLKEDTLDRSSRDIRIAAKTLVLSTIVYLGVGLWLTLGIQNATIVSDTDAFCMHRVQRYCKLSWSSADMFS